MRLFRMVFYRALALGSLLLGMIGILIPGLPTVPFILLAAFAASRGWPALEQYLLDHPTFGHSIKLWRQAGVVPRTAKYWASVMMLASLCLLWFGASPIMFKAVVTSVVVVVAVWLWRRPEYAPVKES